MPNNWPSKFAMTSRNCSSWLRDPKHSATLDQMERSLFRQILRLGLKLLRLFVQSRVEAESHQLLVRKGRAALPYHSQKPLAYFSIFGKLTFARAYFYAAGQG